MCTGHFLPPVEKVLDGKAYKEGVGEGQVQEEEQVLVATEDGIIHTLDGSLKLTPLVRVGFQLTSLLTLPAIAADRAVGALDALVCTGHFDGFRVYEGETLVSSVDVGDWVDAAAVGDILGDDGCELAILVDNTVRIYKVPRGEAVDVDMTDGMS
jgi:hypothetical protein